MKKIYFKFNGGTLGAWENPAQGWIAVGDCALRDNTQLLTASCMNGDELEKEGEKLKRLIDEAVVVGRRKLSSSKPA